MSKMKTNVRALVRKSVWAGIVLAQVNGNIWIYSDCRISVGIKRDQLSDGRVHRPDANLS